MPTTVCPINYQTCLLQSAQTRTTEEQPLPKPSFIMSNILAARPVPPTRATKAGRSRASKRKAVTPKKSTTPKKAKAPNKDKATKKDP